MKRIVFISFLIIAALELRSQATLQLSLAECIQYAEEHNYSIQNAALNYNSAEIAMNSSKLFIAPSISASASQGLSYSHGTTNGGTSWNGQYALNTAITLFQGLYNYNAIKQSELNITQTQLQIEQNKNLVKINIIKSYLSILMNIELIEYQKNVLETSKHQYLQGKDQYKVGQILESDFLLLEAQYLADSLEIDNTNIIIDNNLLVLKNLLALPSSQTLSLIIPDQEELLKEMVLPDLQLVMNRAFAYLPDLKINSNKVTMAQYDLKMARSSYYPTLSLSAGITTGYNTTQSISNSQWLSALGENIGLNLSIPIYQRNSIRNRVKLSKIIVKQTQLDEQQAILDTRKEIEEYYLNLKKVLNDFQVSNIQKQAYYSSYIAYNQKFQYGSITTADLLQQQTGYLNKLYNYMQNKYQFLLQSKILDVYMGNEIVL